VIARPRSQFMAKENVASPTRVVSVCLDLSPSHGGMFRAVVDLAQMLGGKIVSFRDGSGSIPYGDVGVPVESIDWSGLSLVQQALAPPRLVKRALKDAVAGADVIVVHSLFRSHAMLVRAIAQDTSVPYLVVPHGALDPVLWSSKTFARRVWLACGGRAFLKSAASVVFATGAERDGAVATLGWRPELEVIPLAVPVAPLGEARDDARKALGLPLGRRLILVLGRLVDGKRPREILSAFCEADPRDCDLVFAGPDGDVTAQTLRAEIPSAMQSRVWTTGPLEASRRDLVLAACDVYLSWSCHESFGYAAAEAMAAGMPVILSPGNALPQNPAWPACGLLPPSDDTEALAEALQSCADWSESKCRIMGEAGRNWVARYLNSGRVARLWNELVKHVVEQNRGSGH